MDFYGILYHCRSSQTNHRAVVLARAAVPIGSRPFKLRLDEGSDVWTSLASKHPLHHHLRRQLSGRPFELGTDLEPIQSTSPYWQACLENPIPTMFTAPKLQSKSNQLIAVGTLRCLL